jgi:hypothetical protein
MTSEGEKLLSVQPLTHPFSIRQWAVVEPQKLYVD